MWNQVGKRVDDAEYNNWKIDGISYQNSLKLGYFLNWNDSGHERNQGKKIY